MSSALVFLSSAPLRTDRLALTTPALAGATSERTMEADDPRDVGAAARSSSAVAPPKQKPIARDAARIQGACVGLRTQHLERLADPRAQLAAIGVKAA